MTNKITYFNSKPNVHFLQLSLNFNVDTIIPEDNKVRLVCNIVERMNLESLLSTYSHKGRKPVLDPVTFLKVLLFCFSEGIFETRKIENFCKYDIRGRYLLGNGKAPDHSTISRFQNHLVSMMNDLLTEFVEILIEEGHLDLKSIYIDGTKIESAANRYSFVWKKTIEKNQEKLRLKMIEKLSMPDKSSLSEVMKKVEVEFNKIRQECSKKKIEFVYGKGKRKTPEQKEYEYLNEAMERFKTYKSHLEIMGDRNSYSKTDHDATFMRMKDDHMLNGQLKPAYNIQIATSGAFIIGVMGSQKANDLHTLKPFLDQMLPSYGKYIKNLCADAGYESVENYASLEEIGIKSYIKPANHYTKKKRKTRNDIGRKENMRYIEEEDAYECKAGKKLIRGKDTKKVSSSGYEDTVIKYVCYECMGCEYSAQCIKSRTNKNPWKKTIAYSPKFEEYRKESEKNIESEEGINQRINRSIQSEGAFSKIKDGLGYERFRHRGMKKIVADIIMASMGININKLHRKILAGQKGIIEYKKTA